jgi:hypothetical protein
MNIGYRRGDSGWLIGSFKFDAELYVVALDRFVLLEPNTRSLCYH